MLLVKQDRHRFIFTLTSTGQQEHEWKGAIGKLPKHELLIQAIRGRKSWSWFWSRDAAPRSNSRLRFPIDHRHVSASIVCNLLISSRDYTHSTVQGSARTKKITRRAVATYGAHVYFFSLFLSLRCVSPVCIYPRPKYEQDHGTSCPPGQQYIFLELILHQLLSPSGSEEIVKVSDIQLGTIRHRRILPAWISLRINNADQIR